MDILCRVFHIITEPGRYMFVSVNRRNNEMRAHIIPKYPWIYGYFLQYMTSYVKQAGVRTISSNILVGLGGL